MRTADIKPGVQIGALFHWCSVAGADDSRTICLFVPPRSF